jgi:hypothetical protein
MQQRAFARPRRADDRHALAASDGEVDSSSTGTSSGPVR